MKLIGSLTCPYVRKIRIILAENILAMILISIFPGILIPTLLLTTRWVRSLS